MFKTGTVNLTDSSTLPKCMHACVEFLLHACNIIYIYILVNVN